jgi:hypothetical protein
MNASRLLGFYTGLALAFATCLDATQVPEETVPDEKPGSLPPTPSR